MSTKKISDLTVDELVDLLNQNSQKQDSDKGYMTALEVGDYFRISQRTVVEWKKNGTLNPIRINGRVLFDKKDILSLGRDQKGKHQKVNNPKI